MKCIGIFYTRIFLVVNNSLHTVPLQKTGTSRRKPDGTKEIRPFTIQTQLSQLPTTQKLYPLREDPLHVARSSRGAVTVNEPRFFNDDASGSEIFDPSNMNQIEGNAEASLNVAKGWE
jgi:hypothetical protein